MCRPPDGRVPAPASPSPDCAERCSQCVCDTIDGTTNTSSLLSDLWQRHLPGRVLCRDTRNRPCYIGAFGPGSGPESPVFFSGLLESTVFFFSGLLSCLMFQSGITGLHVRVSVPIEPIHEVSRTLTPERLDIISNGDCLCWEFLATLSNLTTNYDSISDRLCRYHQDYYRRRSKTDHDCSCHTNPKPHFCTDCGHCHECGCDLCTTSTANFHRCYCPLCLNRCCGLLGPDPKHLELTQRRHRLLRLKQSIAACASTSRHGHPPPTLDRALAELRLEPARAEFISTGLRPPPLTRQTSATANSTLNDAPSRLQGHPEDIPPPLVFPLPPQRPSAVVNPLPRPANTPLPEDDWDSPADNVSVDSWGIPSDAYANGATAADPAHQQQ